MSRSAVGVDYRPFQVFQKLVLSRSRELYYIGGSDVLPAPLEPKREAYVISRLKTDQEQEARSLLIEHNLRLVVYIARKFDNTGVGVEDLISIGTIGLIKAINTFNPVKNIKLATYASRSGSEYWGEWDDPPADHSFSGGQAGPDCRRAAAARREDCRYPGGSLYRNGGGKRAVRSSGVEIGRAHV